MGKTKIKEYSLQGRLGSLFTSVSNKSLLQDFKIVKIHFLSGVIVDDILSKRRRQKDY